MLLVSCSPLFKPASPNIESARMKVQKQEGLSKDIKQEVMKKEPSFSHYRLAEDYYDYSIQWDLTKGRLVLSGRGSIQDFDEANVYFHKKEPASSP